jgi:hypothetical protein
VNESAVAAQGVDVVFLSEHYGLKSVDDQKAIAVGVWQEKLPALIESLRADGIEPVVLADEPLPRDHVPNCVSERKRNIHCEGIPVKPTRRL